MIFSGVEIGQNVRFVKYCERTPRKRQRGHFAKSSLQNGAQAAERSEAPTHLPRTPQGTRPKGATLHRGRLRKEDEPSDATCNHDATPEGLSRGRLRMPPATTTPARKAPKGYSRTRGQATEGSRGAQRPKPRAPRSAAEPPNEAHPEWAGRKTPQRGRSPNERTSRPTVARDARAQGRPTRGTP